MTEKTPKIGKKGGAKRITDRLKEIRRTPISGEVFRIVDEPSPPRLKEKPLKKIATPKDLGG